MMKIRELFKGIKCTLYNVRPGDKVIGLSVDSRTVKKGHLFIAVKGHDKDGHYFIGEAIENGALCICSQKMPAQFRQNGFIVTGDTSRALPVLASRFYGEPSKGLKFTGVTGTNGKTTTTHLIYEVLRAAKMRPALLGTIHHKFGKGLRHSTHTTPGPLRLHELLGRIKKNHCKHVVMEVSSHALKQSRTAGIDYDVAALTNVTGDHLDYHITMEDYIRSKIRLFESLRKKSTAVLNRDDRYYGRFHKSTSASIVTYGFNKKSDFAAHSLEMDMNGSSFVLETPEGPAEIATSLVGRYNIYNILAAAAASYSLGAGQEAIEKAISRFRRVSGRMEAIDRGQPFKVFVDYAHTHDALKNVLAEIRTLTRGDLIVVFGCGGDRDRRKRPLMGRVASELADHVILTNDNPRSEDPGAILNEIESGFGKGFMCYERVPDRHEAIRRSFMNRSPFDTVVIAGKGHEDRQIVGERSFPFSDKKAAEGILDVYAGRNNKRHRRKAAVPG